MGGEGGCTKKKRKEILKVVKQYTVCTVEKKKIKNILLEVNR